MGVSSEVIPEMETLEQNFAERKEAVDAIRGEESDFYEQGGTDAAAYSGEEYRR